MKKGTYYPVDCDVNCLPNDRFFSIQLKNNVEIYGGFFGDETALDQRDPVLNETILSGDIGTNNTISNSVHVVFGNQVDETAVLDGFIIREGLADGASGTENAHGGGLYLKATAGGSCGPHIQNCIFIANSALERGAAVYLDATGGGIINAVFGNCRFLDNQVTDLGGGGSVASFVDGGGQISPVFTGCIFRSNNSADKGGAIAWYATGENSISQPRLEACQFDLNEAVNYGGAIYALAEDQADHQTIVHHCSFDSNTAGQGGGAIFDQASLSAISHSRIANSQFLENSTGGEGAGVFFSRQHHR